MNQPLNERRSWHPLDRLTDFNPTASSYQP